MTKQQRLRPSQGGKMDRTSGPAGGMDPGDVPDDAEVRRVEWSPADDVSPSLSAEERMRKTIALAAERIRSERIRSATCLTEGLPMPHQVDEEHKCKVSRKIADPVTYFHLTRCDECGKVTAHDRGRSQVLSDPRDELLARIAFDLEEKRENTYAGMQAAMNGLPKSVRQACDGADISNLPQIIESMATVTDLARAGERFTLRRDTPSGPVICGYEKSDDAFRALAFHSDQDDTRTLFVVDRSGAIYATSRVWNG